MRLFHIIQFYSNNPRTDLALSCIARELCYQDYRYYAIKHNKGIVKQSVYNRMVKEFNAALDYEEKQLDN